MSGVNKVILLGNVGNDPEVRSMQDGTQVASIGLATSESYKNKKGERVNTTEWHKVIMWRNLAELAEKYIKKGSQLYIEGKLRTRSWEDKDKVKRFTTEIIADTIQFIGKKDSDTNSHSESMLPNDPDNNDGLPF